VGTTRRFPSRPVTTLFKPRHTLVTNESYSKLQIRWESVLLLCESKIVMLVKGGLSSVVVDVSTRPRSSVVHLIQ
jgi:hypothetical protein